MTRLVPAVLALAFWSVAVIQGELRPPLPGVPAADAPAPLDDAFFDDSVLHEIRLTISSRDWSALKAHFLDDTYYQCHIQWRDVTVRNVGIRSRGTGSRSGVKPGLRVDLDRYVTDQTFLGLKSFILRNQTQDASNMHERISMLLSRRLGLLAPREAHVRLYVNNADVGVYTIVESIDKTFLQRHVGEDSGYLFKYDYPADAAPYYFEDRGSKPPLYVPLPFQPETHEADARPEFIVQLVQAINQPGTTAAFQSAIGEFLDLRPFLLWLAVERYVADVDGFLSDYGGMNNYYLYRFDNQKRFSFIAWDKSEAFKGGSGYSIWRNITGVPAAQQNRLLARTLADREMYDAYLDALMETVRSAQSTEGSPDGRGWLEREIEREYAQIRDAVRADPQKTFTNADFERTVDDLRVFARERGDVVTREVNAARPTNLR